MTATPRTRIIDYMLKDEGDGKRTLIVRHLTKQPHGKSSTYGDTSIGLTERGRQAGASSLGWGYWSPDAFATAHAIMCCALGLLYAPNQNDAIAEAAVVRFGRRWIAAVPEPGGSIAHDDVRSWIDADREANPEDYRCR